MYHQLLKKQEWNFYTGSLPATADRTTNIAYLPYGAENTPSGFSNTCSTRYRFTGFERDLETAYGTSAGNDYAFARYYNQRLQRFMSLDPKSGDTNNSQSLNPYAYVLDNSLNRVDPTGLESFDDNNGGGDSGDPNDNGLSDSPTCGCNYEAEFMGIRSTSAVAFASADLLNSANSWSPDTIEFSGTMCGAKNCTTYVGSFDSWDQYSQWRAGVNSLPENQPSFPILYQQQLDKTVAALEKAKADPGKIEQFKKDNAYDKNETFQLQGGNFDFKDADLFNGLCGPTGRCNNGLDFSHNDHTFHLDTANPLDILHGGPIVHLAVDLIYGNIVSIIPR